MSLSSPPAFDLAPGFKPPSAHCYERRLGVKAYTKGWLNERGEFNVALKSGSYGHATTCMALPTDKVATLYSVALRQSTDCFGQIPPNVAVRLFFQRRDLRPYRDRLLGELGFEATSTVYIKYFVGEEQVFHNGTSWEVGTGNVSSTCFKSAASAAFSY